jgi:hypothetical protein
MAQKAYKPTTRDKDRVQLMRANGWIEERIAQVLRISIPTLRKHFAIDLLYGADIKIAQVMEHLFEASKKHNAGASRYLLEKLLTMKTTQPALASLKNETLRTVKTPKVEKLGKKELALQLAMNPPKDTKLGELMAARRNSLN